MINQAAPGNLRKSELNPPDSHTTSSFDLGVRGQSKKKKKVLTEAQLKQSMRRDEIMRRSSSHSYLITENSAKERRSQLEREALSTQEESHQNISSSAAKNIHMRSGLPYEEVIKLHMQNT